MLSKEAEEDSARRLPSPGVNICRIEGREHTAGGAIAAVFWVLDSTCALVRACQLGQPHDCG